MKARLKSVISLVTSIEAQGSLPFVALDHVESGGGGLRRDAELRKIDAPGAGAASVIPGDVLFGKLRPYLVKSWVADRSVYASTELMCLRPGPAIHSRWLGYLVSSRPFIQWAVATSEGTKMPRTSWEKVAEFRIEISSLARQSAIADYLDCETGRIDAVIDAKRRMMKLLEERDSITFERIIRGYGFRFPAELQPNWGDVSVPCDWKIMRLSLVLDQLTNGYVGPTRDILVDSGVPYIQSLHIKRGQIDFSRRKFFVPQYWHDERPRIHLHGGDVLIVQTGDIGQVAVVPEGFGQASCHALQIARVHREVATGLYLGSYLRSFFGYHSLLSRATGALHPHLEAGIKDIPIAVPPLEVQDRIVEEVRRTNEETGGLRSMLDAQIKLLQERRQALITAAVTGQLEIPETA